MSDVAAEMSPKELKTYAQNRAIANSGLSISGSTKVVVVLAVLGWPLGFFLAGWAGAGALAVAAILKAANSVTEMNDEWDAIASGDVQTVREWLTPADLEEIKAAAAPPKLPGTSMKTPQVAPAAPQEPPTAPTATPTSAQAQTACGSQSDAAGALVPRSPIQLDPDCPHFLLLAGSREGKTNALRCLLDGHNRVNYVSTKVTDQVPAHWESYVIGGVGGNAEATGKKIQWLIKHWATKLAAHAMGTDTEPEWFVFDEAIQLQTYCKRSKVKGLADDLAGLQIEIATQGAAIGAYGVLLAQTKNAGPLGIDLDLLQQNFRMVIPLKNKRRLALSVIEKMGGLKLTLDQQEAILGNPSRYLQLWLGEDEDIYHDVLPEFKGSLKPLVQCPQEGKPPANKPQQPTVEDKVLAHLKRAGASKTPGRLRADIRSLGDWPLEQVERLLDKMVDSGLLAEQEGKYKISSGVDA